ncbi:unnamed protein product, partial [Candidula unifasciata]
MSGVHSCSYNLCLAYTVVGIFVFDIHSCYSGNQNWFIRFFGILPSRLCPFFPVTLTNALVFF